MKKTIKTMLQRLSTREDVLWACLVGQLLLYWTLAFLISSANELVAYQRY